MGYSIEETGRNCIESRGPEVGNKERGFQSGLGVSGRDATIDDKEHRLWGLRVEEMSIHTLVNDVRISRENRQFRVSLLSR